MSTLRFLYIFSSINIFFSSYATTRELQNVIFSLHGFVSSVEFPVSGREQSGILFAETFSIQIYILLCFVLLLHSDYICVQKHINKNADK